MKYSPLFLVFTVLTVLSSIGVSAEWAIDSSHSAARFKIRHMMVSNVNGEFTGISGKFNIDDKDVTKLKAEATIDANTVNTSNADRDKHLKSPDFFDVAKYPKIQFTSKKVIKLGGAKFKLIGDLTLHGVTKEVALEVDELTAPIKDPWGNTRRGLSGTTKINRKDFGISWNKVLDGGGVALGETADITVEMELTAPAKPAKS